jgi:isopenicillin N synthase-like dioxygenase
MSQPTIAQLESVSYSQLLARHPPELSKLLTACQRDGFFYLDLSGQEMLKDWKTILDLMAAWFAEPIENKMKYWHGTLAHG